MGTKNNPGEFDCYAALDPDEPFFLLRANDDRAFGPIANWVHQTVGQIIAGQRPNTPKQWAKVAEATKNLHDMQQWHHEKHSKPLMEAVVQGVVDTLEAAGVEVVRPEKPKLN